MYWAKKKPRGSGTSYLRYFQQQRFILSKSQSGLESNKSNKRIRCWFFDSLVICKEHAISIKNFNKSKFSFQKN